MGRGQGTAWVALLLGLALASCCSGVWAALPRPLSALRDVQQDCTPRQVHIAVGDDPTAMHVTWRTLGADCPSEVTWWIVRGSAASDASPSAGLAARAVGFSFLASEREMCAAPAAENPFALYLHRAAMTDLTPGARYRYRLAGGDATWPFAAPPPRGGFRGGASGRALRIAAFGDLGDPHHAAAKSPGAAATLEALSGEAPWLDLVLHVGDVSYANGDPEIWDSFMDAIEPLAARVPWMVQAGNHEYGVWRGGKERDPGGLPPYDPSWGNFGPDAGGECGVMLARRFHMPGRQGASDNPPFWYGFDYGPIHFTAISTEHDLSPDSPQRAWLAAELAAVDRCATPWLVLLLHRPMYVVYPHKSNREVGEHIRASLEPLLDEFGVDLAISGHVHSYYRTCAAYDGACVDGGGDDGSSGDNGSGSSSNGGGQRGKRGGTVHVVVGSAGHELSGIEEHGQEPWLAAAEPNVYGYGRLTAEPGRGGGRLVFEFVASSGGRVHDTVEIPRRARPAKCGGGA